MKLSEIDCSVCLAVLIQLHLASHRRCDHRLFVGFIAGSPALIRAKKEAFGLAWGLAERWAWWTRGRRLFRVKMARLPSFLFRILYGV